MYDEMKGLFDKFLFCLIIPCVSIFLIGVMLFIMLMTIPMYILFWFNPAFELYQNTIWKIFDSIFELSGNDEDLQ